MSTTTIVLLVTMLAGLVFAWQSWRDLSNLRRELERHERARATKTHLLAEAAKLQEVR